MKKTIMTSLFLLFSFGIFAQNQVRISYVSPDSIPSATLDLMDFLDIKYMKMKIHGDIKGKKWQLWVNESHEGKITSKSWSYTPKNEKELQNAGFFLNEM